MMKSILAFAALALVYVYAADCTSKEVEIPAMEIRKEMCPTHAPFYGFMGCASALVFACLGAAYGTAKSCVGVANGCHAPRNDHEVHHPHYYGWCARHLRTHRRCAPRLRNLWKQGLWLRTVLGLLGTRCWSVLWYGWPCCWHRYRNRGRHWSACQRSSAQAVRRCNPPSYLRRGSRPLRSDCGSHPLGQPADMRRHRHQHLLLAVRLLLVGAQDQVLAGRDLCPALWTKASSMPAMSVLVS